MASVTMHVDLVRLNAVRDALEKAQEVVREATNLAVLNRELNARIDELEAELAAVTAERNTLRAKGGM